MLRNIGVNWRDCRLVRNSIKGKPTVLGLEEEPDRDVACYPYLMKGALAQVGDFKIGGRIIIKVRFADDMSIIAKIQEDLQDMVNRLVDTGSKYGIEINIDKSKVMRVFRNHCRLK